MEALYILLIIPLLLLAALINTLCSGRKVSSYKVPDDEARALGYAQKLAEMVKFDSTSYAGAEQRELFLGFHAVLERLFPLVHEKLEKVEIDGNLLFCWKGHSAEKPIVLAAHQDVVPAEGKWRFPPFSGTIAEGKVWGRGAADTKCSLMAELQAIEELLEAGYVPENDVYICSSCTEEWNGGGASKLVRELQRRGVRPFIVCDEGGGIIDEPIGGIHGSYAMVGVWEKGKADVVFTARSRGGHASAPGSKTPIARLAAFINSVEKRNPFRKKFMPELKAMFKTLAPYAPFALRYVLGNLWLFAPLLKAAMPLISPQATAMLRTTIAFTMQSGSKACNVLPQEATVSANMRFIPHQDMDESLEIIKARAEKYGLTMELLSGNASSGTVDIHGEAYKRVEQAIVEVFPGLPSSPYPVTGATDCTFYQEMCDNCIRFSPVLFGMEQMKGLHGINENIEYASLAGAVDFYKALIK